MKKFYASGFLLFILVLCTFLSEAQFQIKGKVYDSHQNQLSEGAFVSIKGSNIYTATDKYGNFAINTNDTTAVILVSHIGYAPTEQLCNYNEPNIIRLSKGNIQLTDVVITTGVNANYFNTLTKVDLNLNPVRSSQELLRIIPGLFIAQHAGGGKAEQIFLRGFDIDHGTDVQVTVDGLPVNMVSHGHGQGYADLHFLIPELVKNIDYGKGPYYAERGNLNTAGYVAFQTTDNVDPKIQLEGGLYNNFGALGIVNLLPKSNIKHKAYVASEFMYFDGPFAATQNFNRFNIFSKYKWQIKEQTDITFISSAFSSKWDASGQIPQRLVDAKIIDRFGAVDNTEGGYTGRYNASISINSNLKNGNSIESQLYYSRYYFRLYSNFTFFLRDTINGDQIRQSDERDIIGANSKYSINTFIGNARSKTTIGINFRTDKTYDTELAYTQRRQFINHEKLGDITETNAAFYIDEKLSINKWLFNIGSRIDYLYFNYLDKLNTLQLPSQSKAIISPKLNIQYTFSDKLMAFFKTGRGFHSNDARVVVANQGNMILPAAYGSDIGIAYHVGKKFLFNASLWHLFLQQEFVYVGDEGIIEPSGRSRRIGIDVSAKYQFSNQLFADANINLASAKFIDLNKGENAIPLAPLTTSTGGISYKNNTGWNGSLRYRYIKDRPASEDNSVVAKGYLVADAAINYTKAKYEAGIVIENMFNTKWNEAQFQTESRLQNEPLPVSELHFTPGLPFFAKLRLAIML